MKQETPGLISGTYDYNLHSHTQFCDGRASMETMAAAALDCGMKIYGFSPHSPVPVESGCNTAKERMDEYLAEASRLRDLYDGKMRILTSMEVDFLSADFGPHIDYFQRLPLDYMIGSVHFVPNQEGIPIDCDGKFDNFSRNLELYFRNDLRYVVEKYFEQVLTMLERCGFHILGHLDKIAGNASQADPDIENQRWFEALIDDVVSHAVSAEVTVEINTKAFNDKKRFFPADRWWHKVLSAGLPIAVNSDAHYPDRIAAGRQEALQCLRKIP